MLSRTGSVRSPIVHKPTRANATGESLHSNFANETLLGSTCGFLKGTGYLDERMLAGSNVLRHKLPPVKLRRSVSSPAVREAELQVLAEMKALEGVLGTKGVRLVGKLREHVSREKVDVAFAAGDMPALRAAFRGAHWGSRLQKDPNMLRVSAVVSKYDKCLIECRDGLEEGDMIRVQLGMDHLAELSEQGLGPRMMEHPILASARSAFDRWAPYRPYLHKLGRMQLAGARPFAQYWLVLVEGTLLSEELEAGATADLVRFGPAGAEALEEALAVPELRYHYDVPWPQKNPLPQMVRSRLAKFGIDVAALKLRVVRERDAAGWPEPNAPTSVVVTGPVEVLHSMEAIADMPGEPAAGRYPAVPDTAEQHAQRAATHRMRLTAARPAVEAADAAAAVDANASSGAGSMRSGPSFSLSSGAGSMHSGPSRARKTGSRRPPPSDMFTKTF